MSLHVQLHFLFVKFPSQKRRVRYCVVQHMCLLSDKKCHPHSICCLPHQCLELDHTSNQNHRSKNMRTRVTVNPQTDQRPQKSSCSTFGTKIFGPLYFWDGEICAKDICAKDICAKDIEGSLSMHHPVSFTKTEISTTIVKNQQ